MSDRLMRETAKLEQQKEAKRTKRARAWAAVQSSNKPKLTLKESFQWLVPEAFKTQDFGKNQVRLKGVALKSDIISKNKRKYVEEELLRRASTLTGKPVTVNHDNNKIIGHVDWAEYEAPNLECLLTIKKEPYVSMVREKDPRINGLSVQAGYIANKCVKCGERFYSEEAFKNHMKEKHNIVDGITEPHGIIFDGLSLVLSPEVPGVPETSLEIFETAPGALQLFEMVIKEAQMGISKGSGLMTDKTLEEGCRWKEQGFDSGEACVSAMTGKVDDPEAFCYGPAEEMKEQEEEPETDHGCGEDEVYNSATGKCEPVGEAVHHLPEIFLKGTKTQLKETYEKILTELDNQFTNYRETHVLDKEILETIQAIPQAIIQFNQRLSRLEQRYNEKVLTETDHHKTVMENLEKRITHLENDYSHVRKFSQFKAQSKAVLKETVGHTVDPEKMMRATAKKGR